MKRIITLLAIISINYLNAADLDLHKGGKSWGAYYNTLSDKDKQEIQNTVKLAKKEMLAIDKKNRNDVNKFDSGWFIIPEPTAKEKSDARGPGLKIIIQSRKSVVPVTAFISAGMVGYFLQKQG